MALTRSIETAFDSAVEWSFKRPLPPRLRYLVAALVIGTVAIYRAAFVTDLLPWLLFLPAILGVALLLGEGPGYFSVLFAAFLAGLSIGSSNRVFWMTAEQWLASLLFVAVGTGVAALAAALRSSLHKAAELNARLAERETFLSSVLAASTDCLRVVDLDGTLSFASQGGMAVDDATGSLWPGLWEGDDQQAIAALAEARAGRTAHFVGQAKGAEQWWSVSVSPIRDAGGHVARILSVSRDHTALMEARRQQDMLNGELEHRLKNMLTIIQSIASQTFKTARDLSEANHSFAARLTSLGQAADVLTAGAWRKARFRDVIEAGLTAVAGVRDRIQVGGPVIELESQTALALTLALHELATNALKYGALSNETGSIAIHWAVTGPEERFSFLWRETGGPPVVPPTHQGFGSRMIERSLRSYFKGSARFTYAPTGVELAIDAPLAGVGERIASEG